jgi:hypothetical protein
LALLTERDLGELFASFRSTAFRFEIRDRYNSDVGREAFRKFLADEPDDYVWHQPWLNQIRRDRAAGKTWQRIRIVTVPLSDWSRYGIAVARTGLEAGDEIRYLRRETAYELGLDPLDAWLFDDRDLIHLHFNDDDTFRGAEAVTDPQVVAEHRCWRDLAWQHALALEDFVASVSP